MPYNFSHFFRAISSACCPVLLLPNNLSKLTSNVTTSMKTFLIIPTCYLSLLSISTLCSSPIVLYQPFAKVIFSYHPLSITCSFRILRFLRELSMYLSKYHAHTHLDAKMVVAFNLLESNQTVRPNRSSGYNHQLYT